MKNALRSLLKEQNLKIQTGLYKSHDGYMYFVEGSAKNRETLQDMVVYQAMFKDSKFGEYPIWIMPLSEFLSEIEVNDKKVLRFIFLGIEESIKFEQELIFLMGHIK